jgi:hypothetical protein
MTSVTISLTALLVVLAAILAVEAGIATDASKESRTNTVSVPRIWTDAGMASVELPLPAPGPTPIHVSEDYYYRIPVRPMFRSYPVYHPDHEPQGYFEWLKQQEPQIVFDPSTLKTEPDWIKAGEVVFEEGAFYSDGVELESVRNREWYTRARIPLATGGVFAYARYFIRQRGKIELGTDGCIACHTRVLPDGSAIRGAQGNFPLDRGVGIELARAAAAAQDRGAFERDIRASNRRSWAAPWSSQDPFVRLDRLMFNEMTAVFEAIPPGAHFRQRSSPFHPPVIPNLIGVKDLKYLDITGLVRHRSIEDLMRYAALNQGGDSLTRFGDFVPRAADFRTLPAPETQSRYSDEQLYALAKYVYSLQPPPNPHRPDSTTAAGQRVFERERCGTCHTPPLYTNNMLTPAEGFTPPPDHLRKFDVLRVSVGTDPALTLHTRRGTGYYKVPSLRGVWYRGPFEHNGSVATLDDWFDPGRLRDDYVPTGFRGAGVKTRAVRGHAFGLKLSVEDKAALIAFLKTL